MLATRQHLKSLYPFAILYLRTAAPLFLENAVQTLLEDRTFGPPSLLAVAGRQIGEQLQQWLAEPQNQREATKFTAALNASLETCFSDHLSMRMRRERMWGTFHEVRCSPPFKMMWEAFLSDNLSITASPTFYQYITDAFFRSMIKEHFPVTSSDNSREGNETVTLTYQEENALRYAAGYVTRHLVKTVKRSAIPNRDEIELCLLELNEVVSDEDDESEDWVQSVDRGGLKHVTNITYMVFKAMECELRKHLIISKIMHCNHFKHKVKVYIEKNDDVQFYWCMVSAGWADNMAHITLDLIIDLYITIRGFSAASGWLEMYKQAFQKTVQKMKGVRKQLI